MTVSLMIVSGLLAHFVAVLQIRRADSRSGPRRRSARLRCARPGRWPAPVFTARRTALPSSITNTAPSRTAEPGTTHDWAAAARARGVGFSSARNATLAFISGRRYSSGFATFTFTCTVAFWRLASGEISLMKPSYLRSGKASVVTMPCCFGVQLGEIVLADVQFHFQIVQVGQRDHVALGAAVAHEAGGDELALLHGALQDGAGDRRADDGVVEIGLRVGDARPWPAPPARAWRRSAPAAGRSSPARRSSAASSRLCTRGVVARLRVVERPAATSRLRFTSLRCAPA